MAEDPRAPPYLCEMIAQKNIHLREYGYHKRVCDRSHQYGSPGLITCGKGDGSSAYVESDTSTGTSGYRATMRYRSPLVVTRWTFRTDVS